MIVELAERGSAYVRYRLNERIVEPQVEVVGDGSEVLVDVNEDGQIIGIEIVDVTIAESVAAARSFAAERGLPFPQDIAAAARSIAAA